MKKRSSLFGEALGPLFLFILLSLYSPNLLAGDSKHEPQSEKPCSVKVVWSTRELNETIPPGKTKTVAVSFRSNCKLSKTAVIATPSLSKIISISPANFPTIDANRSYQLAVSMLIPEKSSRSTFRGTIQLIDKTRGNEHGYHESLKVTIEKEAPAPTIGNVVASPTIIAVNTPIYVTVTSVITGHPSSVHLLKTSVDGKSIFLGLLNDDGRNGDAIAGDRTYSTRICFREYSTGQIGIQISAAFKKLQKEIFSTTVIIDVANAATIIGSEGGTLTLDDPSSTLKGASIWIPPGALASQTQIYMRELPMPSALTKLGDGPLLEVGPHELQFLSPVEVSWPCPKCQSDQKGYIPCKSFNREGKLLFFEDYSLEVRTDGITFVTVHVLSLSVFFAVENQPFPFDQVYYLHSQEENGYPLNAFKYQRCTEVNPSCDPVDPINGPVLHQWPLDKQAVDSAIRAALGAASVPTPLVFIDVNTEDPNVKTYEQFVNFLNLHGGLDRGLIITFDGGGWLDLLQPGKFPLGVSGYTSYLLANPVKTIVLADAWYHYTYTNPPFPLGWRVDFEQPHGLNNASDQYELNNGIISRRITYSLQTVLLHELGHSLGLQHSYDDCSDGFPIMCSEIDPTATASRWEPEDSHRLMELYGAEPASVRVWENSFSWNTGRTGILGYNLSCQPNGGKISCSIDYDIYDRHNPSAIAQLFVAVEREVVEVLYNGIPGTLGFKGSGVFQLDPIQFGKSATIYLAGTWALGVDAGEYHYKFQNGGWRCPIGEIYHDGGIYRLRITEPSGLPLPNIQVLVYTSSQSFSPGRSDLHGELDFAADEYIRAIILYDPQGRFAPKALPIGNSGREYLVSMDQPYTSMDRWSAEQVLNQLVETISTVVDFAEILRMIELPGTVATVPGLFSMAPYVQNGELWISVSGLLAEQVAEYVFRFLPDSSKVVISGGVTFSF